VTGREVAVLADGARPAGRYTETWTGNRSGIYFMRLVTDGHRDTRSFVIIR